MRKKDIREREITEVGYIEEKIVQMTCGGDIRTKDIQRTYGGSRQASRGQFAKLHQVSWHHLRAGFVHIREYDALEIRRFPAQSTPCLFGPMFPSQRLQKRIKTKENRTGFFPGFYNNTEQQSKCKFVFARLLHTYVYIERGGTCHPF